MNKEKLLPCWLQQCWRMILRTDQVSVRLEQLQHKRFQHWLLSAVSVDEYRYNKLTSKIQQKQWFYNQRGTFCFGILNYVCISIPYILPPPGYGKKIPSTSHQISQIKLNFDLLFLLAHLPKNLKNLIFWLGFCANFASISSVTRNCFVKTSETCKTSCAG